MRHSRSSEAICYSAAVTHADSVVVRPAGPIRGRISVPGDKSISHRYALLAAIADGESALAGYSPGADCRTTLQCLRALGVEIHDEATSSGAARAVRITGRGLTGLRKPGQTLDAENSGTTVRLLAGLLAAHPFTVTITGDASLRRRPMRRVMEPLEQMGARLESTDGHLPLTMTGGALSSLTFEPRVPSAQVKSAVLLAGLQAAGITAVREALPTRDHTERALRAFGARVEFEAGWIRLRGGQRLAAGRFDVPGDMSSAAFWAVAAAAVPGSDLEVVDVGLNPTRTAILDVLRRAGAHVEVDLQGAGANEPRGRIRVRHGNLRRLTIEPAEVPGLIDELPALAALATHGGEMLVTGAGELRVKESDRIAALAAGLRALGADIEEQPDGFHVRARRLRGGMADAASDHRLAMAFAIAALGASGPSTITGAGAVAVSYPGFFEVLDSICA